MRDKNCIICRCAHRGEASGVQPELFTTEPIPLVENRKLYIIMWLSTAGSHYFILKGEKQQVSSGEEGLALPIYHIHGNYH